MSKPRTVTVIFEGTDWNGDDFTFTRTVAAEKGGDNPRFYGEQFMSSVEGVTARMLRSVEGVYGQPPA